ncbi:MAG TPA: DUF523 domain-containing protein [Candidatus Ozemobacteraceae bacterium]|nr:DUF523 domain-containing protein [Candidatus Ozemobacteraceae bacterium]
MPGRIILVSACLLGVASNYKGTFHPAWESHFCRLVPAAKAAGIVFVPVCPEQLGGLPTPRLPSELQGSAESVLAGRTRVLAIDGADVTRPFVAGAEAAGHIARTLTADGAILSERSPSCGVHRVYDGSFGGKPIAGVGLATFVLHRLGIPTVSHQDLVESWNRETDPGCVHLLTRSLNWKSF